MAHSKRTQKHIDQIQLKCQNEAKQFVIDYYNRNNRVCSKDNLYINWFAFIPSGWKCMIASGINRNHYFEVTKHVSSGEMYCNCYNLFEHIVRPSNDPAYIFYSASDIEMY